MSKVWQLIDKANTRMGEVMGYLLAIMVSMLVYGVVMRYIFESPSDWAGELSGFLFCAITLLTGGYTLLTGGHVNMNAVQEKLPPKVRAVVDIIAQTFFFLFVVAMLVYGIDLFSWSLRMKEVSVNPWHPPLYPVKFLVPLGAFFLLLQGVSVLRQLILSARSIFKGSSKAMQ